MDCCNVNGCQARPTIRTVDSAGHIGEIMCRPHAIEYARSFVSRFRWIDERGNPIVRIDIVELA